MRGLAHPALFTGPGSASSKEQSGQGHSEGGAPHAAPAAATSSSSASNGSSKGSRDAKSKDQGDQGIPNSMTNTYRTFGAVPVSGTNFFRLLAAGEAVLL